MIEVMTWKYLLGHTWIVACVDAAVYSIREHFVGRPVYTNMASNTNEWYEKALVLEWLDCVFPEFRSTRISRGSLHQGIKFLIVGTTRKELIPYLGPDFVLEPATRTVHRNPLAWSDRCLADLSMGAPQLWSFDHFKLGKTIFQFSLLVGFIARLIGWLGPGS